MELKRILARNARTANEKAIAQYGPDVLVISSSQVNGLTELIVAVDLPSLTLEEAEPFLKSEFANASDKAPASKFDVLLGQTFEDNKRQARERQATQVAKPIIQVNAKAEPVKAKVTAKPVVKAKATEAEQEIRDHEMVRGREIVELVREELASLRREFKLSQQMATWQGTMPLPPALSPLRDALNDAPIPVALRALLIDSIKDHDNMADAKLALQNQLTHAVEQEQLTVPSSGIHVLVGPSGAGKSLMVARLAQAASLAHGSEKVMVISYHDQRAGAWNQTQLLSAQSGVDCFRATNITIWIATVVALAYMPLASVLTIIPKRFKQSGNIWRLWIQCLFHIGEWSAGCKSLCHLMLRWICTGQQSGSTWRTHACVTECSIKTKSIYFEKR